MKLLLSLCSLISFPGCESVDVPIDQPKPPIEMPLPGKPSPQPAPIKPAPGPAPAPIPGADAINLQLWEEINKARAGKGLAKVELDGKLSCGAKIHAEDIGPKRICGHTGSDGSSPTERLARCDYRGGWGEIVACGQRTPSEAVKAWHNSPGHAAIMYDSRNTYVGVHMINNYWVAVFR